MNLLIYVKRDLMELWALYKLLMIKNHMNLSLFIVETVNCHCFTIRDITMHLCYGNGALRSCTFLTHFS